MSVTITFGVFFLDGNVVYSKLSGLSAYFIKGGANLKRAINVRQWARRSAALCVLVCTGSAFAGLKYDGDSVPTLSAASALNTPLGVRSYGMGMAQTGNSNDLSALYYNPAGLATMNYVEYGLSYHGAPNDVAGHSFLMSIPLWYGTMGLTGVYNTAQDNEYIQNGVNVLPDRNKYSYLAGLSYGAPVFIRKLNAGINIKWFGANFLDAPKTTTYEQQSKGLFIDLGLLGTFDPAHYSEWLRWLPRFSAGFTARNLHPLLKLDNEVSRADNREEYNAGVSMHFPYKVMLNVDAVNTINVPTRFRYGIEYWPVHFLALRGGITHATNGSTYNSVHWGLGFGETVGSSKLSFEYSGAKEFPDGFGQNFERQNSTYHRFAFHHSFETVEMQRGRLTPIRFNERYTHRFRFARELAPREIIADTVLALPSENPAYDAAIAAVQPADGGSGGSGGMDIAPGDDVQPQQPEDKPKPGQKPKPKPKPTNIVGKYIIAVLPFTEEVVAGRPKNSSLRERLRGNFVVRVNMSGAARLINPAKMTSAPQQANGELESAYLKRLQKAIGADLIVFNKLMVDGVSGELKLITLYYRRGDNTLSAQNEVVGSDSSELDFVKRATAQFEKEHKALLEEFK